MHDWRRDSDGPALSLGAPGAFDDEHIFAPCVACLDGRWRMWYCGSRGDVDERRFALGLASSDDGLVFSRGPAHALLGFDDDRSLLTPALVRHGDGSPARIDGQLCFYGSACDFPKGDGTHHLHRFASRDGRSFDRISEPLLADAYAPTVLRCADGLRMWYVDTAAAEWCIRHARSADGWHWVVDDEPALVVDQTWEHRRLNYPYVLEHDGAFVMWYSSRLDAPGSGPASTAIGFASSSDGLRWQKHPGNPLLRPDATRAWEAGYCSNPCVLPQPEGGWRMWYSARPAAAMRHKYFAIATARSDG